MQLWTMWVDFLNDGLYAFIAHFGVSQAAGIILLSLLVRAALFPLSLAAARSMQKNKVALEQVKPEVERLRETLKDQPTELATQTMALYRQNGIRLMGWPTLLNMVSQSVFGIGFLQALKAANFHSRFLWLADLGKPDMLLSILVGALLFFSMQVAPGSADQHAQLMIWIPVLISTIALLSFPSAVGLYWATSNAVGVAQALLLRRSAAVAATHASPPRN